MSIPISVVTPASRGVEHLISKKESSRFKKGHLMSPEIRQKISDTLKGRPSPRKDCHPSLKTRMKTSLALKGYTPPEKRIQTNLRRYGLTIEQYSKMLHGNEMRAACSEKFIRTPHIDHNHTSKKIRGLLCRRCNHIIGLAKEDLTILKNAIKYLQEN
jgi:hypothetical protein